MGIMCGGVVAWFDGYVVEWVLCVVVLLQGVVDMLLNGYYVWCCCCMV